MSRFVREGGKCFDDDGDKVRRTDYNRCTMMSFVGVVPVQAAANAPLLSIDNTVKKDGIVH